MCSDAADVAEAAPRTGIAVHGSMAPPPSEDSTLNRTVTAEQAAAAREQNPYVGDQNPPLRVGPDYSGGAGDGPPLPLVIYSPATPEDGGGSSLPSNNASDFAQWAAAFPANSVVQYRTTGGEWVPARVVKANAENEDFEIQVEGGASSTFTVASRLRAPQG